MITKTFDTVQDICLVTFTWRPHAGVRHVSVCGDFNGWSPGSHPLAKSAAGYFTAAIPLPMGSRYQYKYLCDRGHWHNDEAADSYQSNEWGQVNSVLITIAPPTKRKASATKVEAEVEAEVAPKAVVPAKKAPAKKAPAKKAVAKAAAPVARKAPAKKAAPAKKTPKDKA